MNKAYQFVATLGVCLSISLPLKAEEIPLIKAGALYQVPVKVNGAVMLNFILDSGASEVAIPEDIAARLVETGTVTKADFLPGKVYSLADGSKVTSPRFMIKSLQIGSYTVRNVPAMIVNRKGPLLLGQSLLGRFSVWGVDSRKQVLFVDYSGSSTVASVPSSVSKAGAPKVGSVYPRVAGAADSASPPVTGGNRYPADAVNAFMESCIGGGAPQAYCRCVIDELQNRYSLTEFVDMSVKAKDQGTAPQSLVETARYCMANERSS
jgi:clan AA aspartic protease (TIGR02281 family)